MTNKIPQEIEEKTKTPQQIKNEVEKEKIRRRDCFECLKCRTIYFNKREVINCNCDKLCSSNINGFHKWIYLYSILGMAFYKCKDCGKELIGKTELKYDPLDEIFIQRGNLK